jgi:hypothetical protein
VNEIHRSATRSGHDHAEATKSRVRVRGRSRSVLVLSEDSPYRWPPSLHGREHIFDVRAAYAENVFDAQRDEPIDDEFACQHRR